MAVNATGGKVDWDGAKKAFKPLDRGEWEARVENIRSGLSSIKKTPYVEVIWKVTDAEAVNTDGAKYTGKVWDKYYITPNALFMLHNLAETLGEEIPETYREYDSVEDFAAQGLTEFAEEIRDLFMGQEAVLVTDLVNGTSSDDEGNLKQFVEVVEVKAV